MSTKGRNVNSWGSSRCSSIANKKKKKNADWEL